MSQQLQESLAQQLRALQEENAALKQKLEAAPAPPRSQGSRGGAGASAPAASGASASAEPEVLALRQENANLRTTNELLRRSHETVLRENRQLQAKLERLEGVFVGDVTSPARAPSLRKKSLSEGDNT